MNEDIVPGLLAAIEKDFKKSFQSDDTLKMLYAKVENGTATQADGEKFAHELGKLTASVFHRNVRPEDLPNQRMYYNIANRIIPPTLRQNYGIVNEVMRQVIERQNQEAGIGIRYQEPEFDEHKAHELAWVASQDEDYSKIRNTVETGLDTNTRLVADDCVMKNAWFMHDAGFDVKIERDTDGDCCSWCTDMAGVYEITDRRAAGSRHANCGCTIATVVKKGGSGGKRWTSETESAMMKAEGLVGGDQASESISQLVQSFEQKASEERDRRVHFGSVELFESDSGVIRAREITTGRYKKNNMYVDERASITPSGIREIGWQITSAKQLMGIEDACNIPIVIVDTSEKLASYNPRLNVMYVSSRMADLETVLMLQRGFACSDDPRSTMVHEMFHWMDAEEYRKNVGEISDIRTYDTYQREKSLDTLAELGIVDDDGIRAISEYAYNMCMLLNGFEEVLTEWRTKNILEQI